MLEVSERKDAHAAHFETIRSDNQRDSCYAPLIIVAREPSSTENHLDKQELSGMIACELPVDTPRKLPNRDEATD